MLDRSRLGRPTSTHAHRLMILTWESAAP